MYLEIKPRVESPYGRSYFLTDSWQIGNINLINGQSVDNVVMRYDIVKHLIEFRQGEDIYIVSASRVRHFNWIDHMTARIAQFVRCTDYEHEGVTPLGFYERVYNGGVEVLVHNRVNVFQASASVSLSGSHRSNQIIYAKDYYLAEDKKTIRIQKRNKFNYPLFKPFHEEIRSFARKKGLLFRRQADLIQIVLYYEKLRDGQAISD